MAEQTLLPGALLGVLGGGQLGRMFAMAARRMGYRVAVFAPEQNSPAAQCADRHVRAAYDDLEAVETFGREVDVVTFEFENVPAETAAAAARFAPVRPSGHLLSTTQDRLREKSAIAALGVPVARHLAIESEGDLASAEFGDGVLKSASWGYDGKGQARVERLEDLASAWQRLERQRCVFEAWVPFEREISVVGARGEDGDVALYEPFENDHVNHVLDTTLWPARVAAETRARAQEIARELLVGLEVVGVLCVELFALASGELLVNELAPRPHNSGHLTIEAAQTSQFEQQVRAACCLPLGSTASRAPAAAMVNLLGDLWSGGEPKWTAALAEPGVALHLYGKDEPKPGRKMGHLTATADSLDAAARLAHAARQAL